MKDKHSRTIEVEDGAIIQLTEFVEGRLHISISYLGPEGGIFKKELMLGKDEAIAVSSLLNEWTNKFSH